jgi:hypothetical protein
MDAPRKRALGAASAMQTIEKLTDADIAEVYQSKNLFEGVESMTSELTGLLTLIHALEWKVSSSTLDKATAQALTKGTFGDPLKLATGQLDFKVAAAPEETEMERQKRELSKKKKVSGHQTAAVLASWLPAMKGRIEGEKFLHWQVAFPGVWRQWESAELDGGFDAVIGNPPYVRQELLGSIKPGLRRAYPASYDGCADLYVYFFEQGLKLLRPGGRLSYVVTNKWMRAGYAESLRGHFAEKAWVEFVADFGHAKKFFPAADVFPSVLVIRKPNGKPPPADTQVCVIPRDEVPEKGLSEAVARVTYPLPRAYFTKENWTLEPPGVVALLDKIKRNGMPLAEYSGCKPYRGVLTGFNEAFLIDTPTRNRLIAEDPAAADIIKPYLRGQDVGRWCADWQGLWMIFARRGIEIDRYSTVKRHLQKFRRELEPKPRDWTPERPGEKWAGRKEGTYAWYELQDAVDYWPEFEKQKIIYQVIQFHPSFALDLDGRFGNDKTFIIPTGSRPLLAALNAPVMWWFNWRYLTHLKDEALSPMGYMMEHLPVAPLEGAPADSATAAVDATIARKREIGDASRAVLEWLHHEFGLENPTSSLSAPAGLDAGAFVSAVKDSLPKKRKLSAADIAELKREHAATIEPARKVKAHILALERKLSALVNEAYGLTPEEVQLMWETAPPRMPFTPTGLASPDTNATTVANHDNE